MSKAVTVFVAIITAILVMGGNSFIIHFLSQNDNELAKSIDHNRLKKMYIASFITGFFVGLMPFPINLIMIVPTIVMFVSAETDMLIKQIYVITCALNFLLGISLLFLCGYDIKDYFMHVIFCMVLLAFFTIVKAMNLGDFEMIVAITPYLYMLGSYYGRPTFIELFVFFLMVTCVFALVIYFRAFRKDKAKSLPFAVPACFSYCSYFFVICISNLIN